MHKKPRSIVVSGMLSAVPGHGGWVWAVLQYLLGLRNLGYEVYFLEAISEAALTPRNMPLGATRNARYFASVLSNFGLLDNAALMVNETGESFGIARADIKRISRTAAAFLNISGSLTDLDLVCNIPVRVYLDLDPAFTQLWADAQGINMNFERHTHFVTIGEGIGKEDSLVPDCGRDWITTKQPIVLSYWPETAAPAPDAPFSTIANWRGYGSIDFNGTFYGQKVHAFRELIALPTLTRERIQVALAIHPDEQSDLDLLRRNRWELVDPLQVAFTPAAYQAYILGSKGEIGIAKTGYVRTRCGWFSDRSICYLASGRPVIAQETGFSEFVETGAGLLSFSTAEEAAACMEMASRDFAHHASTARSIAERYFDSKVVLTRLLKILDVST